MALQAEDHYVRIHTDKGSDLILMRLADATAQMGSIPGARTHRSWWVSKSAVKSVRRDNGRVALILTNDTEVPIAAATPPSCARRDGWTHQSRASQLPARHNLSRHPRPPSTSAGDRFRKCGPRESRL